MSIKPSSISIPMWCVRSLIDKAAAQGIARDELLHWASIDQDLLANPKAHINLKQFSRLYAGIIATLEDEEFGLHAEPTRVGSMEVLCRIGTTAPTFADCASLVAKGCNVVLGGVKTDCITVGDEVELTLRERHKNPRKPRLHYEVRLLSLYAILSWLVGQRLPLVFADFPGPPPRHTSELRMLLTENIRFNQPHAALRFAKQAKDLPVIRNAKEIPRFIRRAPGSMIETLLMRESLGFEVRRVLQQALPLQLSLMQVAERLAVSPRTLHRRLEEGGENFQQIKDGLRRDLALQWLAQGASSLKQIATKLGFSDQSTFQRAFVQWTGLPPGEYRRRTRAPSGASVRDTDVD